LKNIDVFECNCGWITRHELVYCPECGKRLVSKKLLESEYYRLSKLNYENNPWQWWSIKYDPMTGEVLPEQELEE
jgi:hypothetical protein